MGNKIIVEFDRKELLKVCRECKEGNNLSYSFCKRTYEERIQCQINNHFKDFKIKEQSNENKRAED